MFLGYDLEPPASSTGRAEDDERLTARQACSGLHGFVSGQVIIVFPARLRT